MAKIIKPPYFESVVNAGEKRLLDFLEVKLPDTYFLIPNVEIASTNPRNNRTQFWEYDLIVVAPHAIYNIENKDWKGRIEGADDYWYINDRQNPNPLKTGRQKTAILASKLKSANRDWGKAWIQNMLTLSYPNSFEPILWQEAAKLSFTLSSKLINYIQDPEQIGKWEAAISDVQNDIVQFLIGEQNRKSPTEKKEIQGYEIIEVLKQESDNYVEYLVKPKNVTSNIRKRVKEYALQVVGLSPDELREREENIKNQFNALQKIRSNPFILPVEFKVDEENHLFYEITDLMEDDSLRSAVRNKTFTFDERVNIVKNVMSALQSAHKENIFHRDINPENIFLSNGYAYLGNFGKSYFTDHNENGYTVMPTINESSATPYHPLELIAKDASRASDIYSLGVLIAWLFSGKEPIKGPFELDKLGGELPKERLPSAENSALPKWVDDVCSKTILTNSDKRIDSIEELEKMIDDAIKVENSNKEDTKTKNASSTTTQQDTYDLNEGDRVDDYIIIKKLGHGGYSRVFKAKHDLQGRDFALKLFHESVSIASVIDEYNALNELNHPNIVKFIWNGQTRYGQFYTTTEFLDGGNLSTYTRTDANLPINTIYQLAEDMLSALSYLQDRAKPILHRDIKPQNIIWDKNGRFVLIDFNVASLTQDNKDYVGTNPYLAPDLIDGQRVNWDLSADTFALGITLYELVTKRYPWPQGRIPKMSIAPEDPKLGNPRISEEFADFLLKAIGTKPETRFSSAKKMLDRLREIGSDNLLAENKEDTGGIVVDQKEYRTEVYIIQGSTRIRLLNEMAKYGELRKTIHSSLNKFKEKIEGYKSSISLQDKLKVLIKTDNEVLINETFWEGGARNFNEGNITKVYNALRESFEDNTNKLKAHKIDVEGIDIVDYINSLYSQSKSGNWGTRVNDRGSLYDEATYSPSKLDRRLIPDILDGRFKLIIITGNAGDGKTAFIRKIENAKSVKNLKRFNHKNGAEFEINNISFESNYDGSQDEDDKINNQVLENFFEPFEGVKNFNNVNEGRIIAINEGRLVEFLKTSEKYQSLHDIIDQYFYKEGHFILPQGLMIINLNLRSVTASDDKESSLFRQQVKALTKKSLWNKCEGCSLANKCFIKYNVDSLNDPASGNEVITRMEWLLRTVGLKRELHITMRDLRSLIAFIISRDHSCEEVDDVYTKLQSTPEKYWQLYYFNITNPDQNDSGDNDRLVKLLRETDIGNVSIPNLDRDLFFGQHVKRNYLDFSDREFNLLETFNKNKIWVPAHEQTDEVLKRIKSIQKTFIRHQFYEGLVRDYKDRLPYQSLQSFHEALSVNNENSISDVELEYETNDDIVHETHFKFDESDLLLESIFEKTFFSQLKELIQKEGKGINNLRLKLEGIEYLGNIKFNKYKGCSWTDFKRHQNTAVLKPFLHTLFKNITKNSLIDLKISLSRAISMNEGCDNEAIWQKYLVLSSSEINDPFSDSFRLFDLNDFELFVNRTDHLVKYLEYEPDSLVFRHKRETHIELVISLDLFEMLYFIQQGYSPSLNDLRGKFVELTIFKNLLENLTYNKVVVTRDNMEFYEISKNANNHLNIAAMQL
ncbi:methylation-associated defense system protein kinase MAD6 [Autumnicola edwardsiae]|uniref:Protein kinase n=1 Tax=Autumnicola edwardsiae TaxID=3075594 RepID=A0ABU3CU53_9FLAO|nr:protein kinase [Zunongwangia sp. F297]MDT0649898.1 protein kinase [Zunongwangia sp. F297]